MKRVTTGGVGAEPFGARERQELRASGGGVPGERRRRDDGGKARDAATASCRDSRLIGVHVLMALVASARHGGGDRKSTRLNSSHANTSYAVFCLKKKKKKQLIFSISKKKKKQK